MSSGPQRKRPRGDNRPQTSEGDAATERERELEAEIRNQMHAVDQINYFIQNMTSGESPNKVHACATVGGEMGRGEGLR